MADIKETVIIEAKTEGEDDVKKLAKAINDSKNATDKQTEASKDLAKQNEKTAKQGKKGFERLNGAVKGVGKGFNILGGAMKAAGIGLVIGLILKLTQAFSQNQQIVDAVNKVFTSINIVFQAVTNSIVNAFNAVSKATGGFDALGKVMSGLLTLALTPIKISFFAIKLALQQAQLAWEQSFFGDEDPETIKRLNEEIKQTQKDLIEVGVSAVNAGKDIVNNVSEAFDEVSQLASTTIENISKVSISASIAAADRLVEARKQAQINEALLEKSIFQSQLLAERQRQIRDDDTRSFKERKEANEELGRLLEKQQKQELALANQRLNTAKLEAQATGNNIENAVAVINAERELLDVKERIAGFESEQQLNRNALANEQKENLKELRLLGKTEFEQKEIESQLELERQRELIEKTVENEEEKNRLLELAEQEHQNRLSLLKGEEEKRKEDLAKTNEKIKKTEQKQLKEKVKNEKQALKESIGAIAEAVGLGKEFAIADAIINTFKGVTETLSAESVLPEPFGTISKIANAGLILGTGIANVNEIKNVKVPGGGGGGGQSIGGGQGATAPPPPSFNLVGQSNTSAITQPITQTEDRPVQAFVVSKNVTTAQQADRNAESASTF